MAELNYPIDNREAYQSRIRFVVKTAKPLSDTFQELMKSTNRIESNTSLDPGLREAAVAKAKERANERIQIGPQYQTDLDLGVVKLFVPIAVTFNDTVDYNQNVDLGVLGGDIAGGIAAGQGLTSSILQGLTKAGTSLMDVARTGIDLTDEYARVAAARFTPGVVGSAVKLTAQATTNPNTRVLFNRVNLRQFQFQFKMIPTSREESLAIEGIIKHFRSEMYPELIASNTGYKFPNAFGITIHHKNAAIGDTVTETDEDGNEITKFSSQGNAKIQRVPDCFLIGVDTSYNGTAGVFHKDGYPSEVDMTLRFVETKAISKKDVEEGF
jgi:hypothetical protein